MEQLHIVSRMSLNYAALLLLGMCSAGLIFSLSCIPEAVPDHGGDGLLRVNDVTAVQSVMTAPLDKHQWGHARKQPRHLDFSVSSKSAMEI
jgi:hypothetical protein